MDISYGKNSATLEDVKKQFEIEKDKEKQAKRARWKKSHHSTPKKSEEELIKMVSEKFMRHDDDNYYYPNIIRGRNYDEDDEDLLNKE